MLGNAVKISTLYGVDIKIDASWLLIAGLIVWSLSIGYFPDRLPDASSAGVLAAAVVSMLGLFGSLILHELAHAAVARRHGVATTGITLFLFGGVAELEADPSDPDTELRVAGAGPIASIAISVLCWVAAAGAARLGAGAGAEAGAGAWAAATAILGYLAVVNMWLALFNLLPAFPLDGGRVFRAILRKRGYTVVSATRRAVGITSVVSWVLIALGISTLFTGGSGFGLWPALVGVFLLVIGRAGLTQVETEHALGARRVADLMTRHPYCAHPDQTLSELVNRLFLAHGVSFAPVVMNGELLGYVDVHMVRGIEREHWTTTAVNDVLEDISEDGQVPPTMPAVALMGRIAKTGRRKFLVVEDGRLIGVVTMSDLLAFLEVVRQIERARDASP